MTLPLDLYDAIGAVVFLVIPNKFVSIKVGFADEGLRSDGTGKEGFTSCVCEGKGACGERLPPWGKSIGVCRLGISARKGVDGKGLIIGSG